jgi:GMP synthase (glutamine-hydrolysing)
MNPELTTIVTTNETMPADTNESFPFPFQQHTFCRYEPVEKHIDQARVLVVDNLLRDENDLSEVAQREWADSVTSQLRRERQIATMALENIQNNIERLVKIPVTHVAHLSELKTAEVEFQPDAIVLSGTLRDFDYYRPEILAGFTEFIHNTKTPVLAICGGHQLVGLSFGARVVTLDNLEQHEQREERIHEYQYRFIRITDPSDPIFGGITNKARILRVWQNHGLQLDRIPEGFSLLATSYLCRNQMMVRRNGEQLIYTVQFHLEKSFEDWYKSRTRWEHPNESRDGRILFENFLNLALDRRQ